MAIGIGTVGALTISSEKEKESSEADTSSYLTNQRQHDIDMEALKGLEGEYQAQESGEEGSSDYVGSWWHLSISADHEDLGPYLSVYDNAAGNPGFEGRIMYLKDDIIIVEIDEDLFEEMPADWQPEGEGKYAVLDCSLSGDDVLLGYRGSEVRFLRDK